MREGVVVNADVVIFLVIDLSDAVWPIHHPSQKLKAQSFTFQKLKLALSSEASILMTSLNHKNSDNFGKNLSLDLKAGQEFRSIIS